MLTVWFWWTLLLLLVAYLSGNKRYRWFYILYKTLPRDIRAATRFTKLNRRISGWVKNQDTVPSVFTKLLEKHPEKILFYFEDAKWTFKQLDDYSNQVGHYFKSKGYIKGDSIALMLENRPEYVGIWLGLSKIGVITALINTNLVSDPLVHCIKVAHCKALIYGTDFKKARDDILQSCDNLEMFEFGGSNFCSELASQSNSVHPEVSSITPKDKIMYIFTSGTTGLPKAAVISHTRYLYAAVGIYSLADLSPKDILYNPLPLYHTAGGMLGIGLGIVFGLAVTLRRKFSASNYWSDCNKYRCTASNYIGEICRYLLAVHKPGTKVVHPVKKMIGNGLRPEMWNQFVETFNIKNVFEFYGSTEGNCNLINIDSTPGSVGFIPRYASFIYPVILIRCDEHSAEPLRNHQGRCIRCSINEPGILVGKIDQKHARSEFGGYADEKATEKKLLRNVFEDGDVFFNTGDVLVQDELGNYYFKDRTGDTFRWKGENVATSEVEAVISKVAQLKDAVVYGVQIPGTEGRAGMAAIVDPDNNLDLNQLAQGLKSKLPGYAIPLFLRVIDSVPMTGTFKLKKLDLQKEAYNYDQIKDHRLYFYDAKKSEYIPLTRQLYQDVVEEKLRL